MCDQCNQTLDEIKNHISSMGRRLAYASDEHYEYSEPLVVGGPGAPKTYQLKSPFDTAVGQQYMVHTMVSSSVSNGLALVSPDRTSTIPGLTSGDTGTPELTNIIGVICSCPTNNMVAVLSGWFDLTDSNGILYVTVNSTQATYLTIQFRRKR